MHEDLQIDVYKTDTGKLPYSEWENSLSIKDRAVITTRLVRIRRGNFGDCKPLKGTNGIYEFRIDFGPGYRIYYGIKGKKSFYCYAVETRERRKKIFKKLKFFGMTI